jgi:hypothetical protein
MLHVANIMCINPKMSSIGCPQGRKFVRCGRKPVPESRNKKKVFNDDNDGFKTMRLERLSGHIPGRSSQGKTQKNRAMCNVKNNNNWWTTECWICRVTLWCYGDEAESLSKRVSLVSILTFKLLLLCSCINVDDQWFEPAVDLYFRRTLFLRVDAGI